MPLETLKREHRRYERDLARVIVSFFAGQQRRVTADLRNFNSITSATVDQVFRVDDEHAAFMQAICSPLAAIMAQAVLSERKRNKPRKRQTVKAAASLTAGIFDELPKSYIDQIREFLDELEQQDYWQAIQTTTKTRLTSLVQQGLEAGDATPKIAKSIREWLGGNNAKSRALAIARTETTGAMNSGHYAVHQQLAADGVISGRVWRAVIDKDTRQTHVHADGQSVKPSELFNIGGEQARFPGDWSLSAAERVRCRCVMTTAST